MILDVGGEWVILGHSERRNIFGENDNVIVVHFHSCSVVNYFLICGIHKPCCTHSGCVSHASHIC